MASDGEEGSKERGRRGRYLHGIVGFLVEYQSPAPLSPWQYSSLIPDTIMSYSTPDPSVHHDLVILRFGRPEKLWEALEGALRGSAGITVNEITVFRNKKNTNRLQYLKSTLFPKKAQKHGLRTWSIVSAAKDFRGMDDFLEHFRSNDLTGSPWSQPRKTKAERLLCKYHLKFSP